MLMHLCEIGLCVSKGTHDNYHEICENILGPKYIDIQYLNFGGFEGGGGYMVHLSFFVYYS